MNIQILQENLLKALTRVGRVVSPRPQLPILQNVKIKVSKDGLEVSATNLESTETVWVGGKVEKEGELCVPARILIEFVSSLPAGAVQLITKDASLHITCAKFSAVIPGVPVAEFPSVEVVEKEKTAVIDKNKFISALSSILFSAASDEGRPILTGIKIKEESDETLFAATDGYRLSTKRITLPLKKFVDAVIPARTLSEVLKIAHEEKDDASIYIGKTTGGQIGFIVGDTTLTTRLLDGEYPNFERIIPKSFTTRVLIEKEPFARAVRSAAIFAKDNANIVRLVLDKQKIIVSANAPQVGENKIEVDAKTDGDGGEIAFNSRFLIEFLANLAEDEFVFEMTGALNPGVFKLSKDESFLHIIMPVRVTS